MSDMAVNAVVVTNVLLGLMTLGVVVACIAGGCASLFQKKAPKRNPQPVEGL